MICMYLGFFSEEDFSRPLLDVGLHWSIVHLPLLPKLPLILFPSSRTHTQGSICLVSHCCWGSLEYLYTSRSPWKHFGKWFKLTFPVLERASVTCYRVTRSCAFQECRLFPVIWGCVPSYNQCWSCMGSWYRWDPDSWHKTPCLN